MTDHELIVSGEKFSETIEAKIDAKEGVFDSDHPFLLTAMRGLAQRVNHEIVPAGFMTATELYLYDVQTGVDSATGEPMPPVLMGMPPMMAEIIRMTAGHFAREAFGQEFGDAVEASYSPKTD